jgi:4-diphosphocytidyl-2-C-methyl-D-erythritol kinase
VTPASVTVQTPAKINLCLGVGPARPDGYHPLATVYQAVGLFDRLEAAPAGPGEVTLRLDTPLPDVPTDEGNLAVRAARLLAARTGATAGAHLRLRKDIPVAGGMAGGSSDAAAALVACNTLWRTGLSLAQLQHVAADLGMDVPFCLGGGTAVGSGRGERVEALSTPGTYHWVLALAHGGLSTPAVYAETDRLRAGSDVPEPVVPADLLDALRAGDAKALGRALCNDLQPAALAMRPELADVLACGAAAGSLGAVVSGSGPTCVFLAADAAHAAEIEAALVEAGACREVRHATGPAPGARTVAA